VSAPLRLMAAVLDSENQAELVLAALNAAGYVCVPREPTKAMLESAWACALDEDAKGLWESMKQPAAQ
jgi:hypothetical protein